MTEIFFYDYDTHRRYPVKEITFTKGEKYAGVDLKFDMPELNGFVNTVHIGALRLEQ